MGDEKDTGELFGELKGIRDDLQEMNRLILGNGQKGLVERTAVMESMVKSTQDMVKDLQASMKELMGAVNGTNKAVEKLQESSKEALTLKSLFNPKNILTFIVIFLVLHEIAEAFPGILQKIMMLTGL